MSLSGTVRSGSNEYERDDADGFSVFEARDRRACDGYRLVELRVVFAATAIH